MKTIYATVQGSLLDFDATQLNIVNGEGCRLVFSFASDWENEYRSVEIKRDAQTRTIALSSNYMMVPNELLQSSGTIIFRAIKGLLGTRQICTDYVAVDFIISNPTNRTRTAESTGARGPEGQRGPAGRQGPTGPVGPPGPEGKEGGTFLPAVSSEGVLSWQNNRGLENPKPLRITGESAYEAAKKGGYQKNLETFYIEMGTLAEQAVFAKEQAERAENAANEIGPKVVQAVSTIEYKGQQELKAIQEAGSAQRNEINQAGNQQVTAAKSYAVGGTGSREGEDKDNSLYYAERARDHSENASGSRTVAAQKANDAVQAAAAAESSARVAKASENISSAKAHEAAASAESALVQANRAKSEADRAAEISGNLGWFENKNALITAYPTGQNGWIAINGETDTIWTWDSDTGKWVDTHTQGIGDYAQAINKPQLNGITLNGNKSLSDLGIQPEGDYATNAEMRSEFNKVVYSVPEKGLSTNDYTDLDKAEVGKVKDKANTADVNKVLAGKANRPQAAVAGNLAALDASGNLTDSGKKVSDFTPYLIYLTLDAAGWTAEGGEKYSHALMDGNIKKEAILLASPADDETSEMIVQMGKEGLSGYNTQNAQEGAKIIFYGLKPEKELRIQLTVMPVQI
jgi:hypothetical protein|nr:MAG TPA: collagen alpha 1(VIII) chain protein [Caudoviricetes sp.]